MERWEAIVVGAGAMGTSALAHLARRGVRALGVEQFSLNHAHGSSHGRTRLLRTVYAEGPQYVPWVLRARELWQALEAETHRELFRPTGILQLGGPSGDQLDRALASARRRRIPHARLTAAQVRERFPAFHPADGTRAVFDPGGGVLFPERCLAAHARVAEERGARWNFNERVRAWSADADGVTVETSRGDYRADQLVIAAGAWVGHLVPSLPFHPLVERQSVFWFEPRRNEMEFAPERMPGFTWDAGGGPDRYFYGTPDFGDGPKFAGFSGHPVASADRVPRTIARRERAGVVRFVRQRFPDAAGPIRSETTCLFTHTPDRDFVLDRLPGRARVVVASPCSGHGFKFASVIGEAIAELVVDGRTRLNRRPFSLARFRPRRARPGGPRRRPPRAT